MAVDQDECLNERNTFKVIMGKDLFFFSLLSHALCFVILILVSDEALWKRPSIGETNFQFLCNSCCPI